MTTNGFQILSPGKLEDAVFAIVFLQSLLIAWFLYLIAGAQGEAAPLFRLLLGIAILFAILFRYSSCLKVSGTVRSLPGSSSRLCCTR